MGSNRVLIISDNLSDCLTYGATLPAPCYDLAVCSSFSAGAEMVEKEDFDFVIVGQGGEKFEARTVLERAARFHPHTPVLVVTEHRDLKGYLDALEMGAVDYLERPEPEDIQWEIETRLRDRSRLVCHDFAPLFGPSTSVAHQPQGKP